MKNLTKITICLALVLMLTGFANAQSKTVKGYFCGERMGNTNGEIFLRVRATIVSFRHQEGHTIGDYEGLSKKQIANLNNDLAKWINFKNKASGKIGAEYVVKTFPKNSEWAKTITFTGKVKRNIKPCSAE